MFKCKLGHKTGGNLSVWWTGGLSHPDGSFQSWNSTILIFFCGTSMLNIKFPLLKCSESTQLRNFFWDCSQTVHFIVCWPLVLPFWWQSGQHVPVSCRGSLFHFLCSLGGQRQQFCHPFASSAVTSRCDLFLNCLRAAALSSSFTSLPWQFRLTKNHSCLFHGSSSLTKTEAGGERKVLRYSYCLDTLKHLPNLGPSLP